MKTIALIGVAAMALGSLCVLAAAQGVLHREPAPAPSALWSGKWPSNAVVIPLTDGKLPFPALAPSGKPEFKVEPLPQPARLARSLVVPSVPPRIYRPGSSNLIVVPRAPARVPAGVYKTEPYSCIVVVPGPHPDDKSIVNPGVGHSSMPVVRPDLRFVPYHPAPAK